MQIRENVDMKILNELLDVYITYVYRKTRGTGSEELNRK